MQGLEIAERYELEARLECTCTWKAWRSEKVTSTTPHRSIAVDSAAQLKPIKINYVALLVGIPAYIAESIRTTMRRLIAWPSEAAQEWIYDSYTRAFHDQKGDRRVPEHQQGWVTRAGIKMRDLEVMARWTGAVRPVGIYPPVRPSHLLFVQLVVGRLLIVQLVLGRFPHWAG